MATELSFQKLSGVFKNPFMAHAVVVTEVRGPADFLALVYQCKFNVDWDGAPTAYGWNRPGSALQQNLVPIERPPHGSLADAASPWQNLWHNHDFSWVGVYSAKPPFADAHNLVIDDRPQLESRRPAPWQDPVMPGERGYFPVVQQQGAPAPGYYVSTTAKVANGSLPEWDQRHYLDASAIPYAVLPRLLKESGVNLGDYGIAIRNKTGKSGGFYFADSGSYNKLGECSGNLVQTVSDGNNDDLVSFIVFPGSGSGSSGGQSPGLIDGIVNGYISRLSQASNSHALIAFLTLHGDLKLMQKTLELSDRQAAQFEILKLAFWQRRLRW